MKRLIMACACLMGLVACGVTWADYPDPNWPQDVQTACQTAMDQLEDAELSEAVMDDANDDMEVSWQLADEAHAAALAKGYSDTEECMIAIMNKYDNAHDYYVYEGDIKATLAGEQYTNYGSDWAMALMWCGYSQWDYAEDAFYDAYYHATLMDLFCFQAATHYDNASVWFDDAADDWNALPPRG